MDHENLKDDESLKDHESSKDHGRVLKWSGEVHVLQA
jgi:hypothetical protein